MNIPSLERMRELAGLPVLREGPVRPIGRGAIGGVEDADLPEKDSAKDLWKYLLWSLTQTTKDPSRTIKELMEKGLRLSDSSSVDSIAGTSISKQITEHLQLWQKLQTSKQKLAVSLKLLEKSRGSK